MEAYQALPCIPHLKGPFLVSFWMQGRSSKNAFFPTSLFWQEDATLGPLVAWDRRSSPTKISLGWGEIQEHLLLPLMEWYLTSQLNNAPLFFFFLPFPAKLIIVKERIIIKSDHGPLLLNRKLRVHYLVYT